MRDIVAGNGGINDQAIATATVQKTGDHTFLKSLQGYGYLLVEVASPDQKTASSITVTMFHVDPTSTKKSQYHQVTVNLATGKVH